MHALKHALKHTLTRIHTPTYTHARTSTHTHTHTHTHAHTRTHTHTRTTDHKGVHNQLCYIINIVVFIATCMGKYWMEKIFGNLVKDAQLAKFFPTNTHKYRETTEDLSQDSPKYSSPFSLLKAICQNCTPPIFFCVRYLRRSKLL